MAKLTLEQARALFEQARDEIISSLEATNEIGTGEWEFVGDRERPNIVTINHYDEDAAIIDGVAQPTQILEAEIQIQWGIAAIKEV